MKSLSLCVIVKDELHLLERCLKSCHQLFDQIVITHTGIKKKEILELTKRYKIDLYDFKWVNDFSKARNFCFSKAKSEYIMWLDSDDTIREEDFNKIKDLKDKNFQNLDVLFFKYEYAHDENGNVTLSHFRERIIKTNKFKWKYPIHEIIDIDWSKNNTQYFDISIHHYRENFSSERNLEIFREIMNNPKNHEDARLIFYYGKELYWENKDESLHWLKVFVKMDGGYFEDKWEAHCKIGLIYLDDKNMELAKKHFLNAIEIEERKVEPYCYLGDIYFRREEWERAKHWYNLGLQIKRPGDSLGISLMEYYTWYPHLQVSVCWYYLGDIYKSIYHNKKCLEYNPHNSQAIQNRNFMKARKPIIKKLHLGCGGDIKEGYLNTDIYRDNGIDETFSMSDIPYQSSSFSEIYCSHALEHLDHYESVEAIKEMSRVLEPSGKLTLRIPDIVGCFLKYSQFSQENINGYKWEDWYKYTIFGIQKSTNKEPKESQFHKTCFKISEIEKILKENNFIIDTIDSYDGYGTPSIKVIAYKKSKDYKVHFYAANDKKFPSTRLRCINVCNWLKKQGIESIISSDKLFGYDIIIFKIFNEESLEWMKRKKEKKRKIFVDLSEDILDNDVVIKMIKLADKVICCSDFLKEKAMTFNNKSFTIEEGWE